METLPSLEHTFEMPNLKGKVTGRVYSGNFTFKRLSIGDKGRAEVLRAKLNGDLKSIDPEIDILHDMLSFLRYGLILFPDWWRECGFGLELYDINVIEFLYKEVMDFEAKWLKGISDDSDRRPEENSSKAS